MDKLLEWLPWSKDEAKRVFLFVTTLLMTVAVAYQAYALHASKRRNDSLRNQLQHVHEVNDSTKALLADERLEKDSLQSLAAAADDLDGDLSAGVEVVLRIDTVEVPVAPVDTDSVPETGTRTAVLEDSTEYGGTVRIDAEAPPYPDTLALGYKLTFPPFEPQVGFVEHGGTYSAVVSWQGENFTVRNAFRKPDQPTRRISFVVGVRSTTFFETDAYTVSEFEVDHGWRWKVGPGLRDGVPYLTFGIERRISTIDVPTWGRLLPFL